VHAHIINLQDHLKHVYSSWGFAQQGELEQPAHMKYWVKPELLDTIGFLTYAKAVRSAPTDSGVESAAKRPRRHG
jgi:hypothetical protein